MKPFLDDDFLLHSPPARTLYYEHAAAMPIYDYHCHLPPDQIAEDRRFDNLTQIWLLGDHYKWRAMRANGIPERLITGDADDWEKFQAWARTVPCTLGNPLYHWTHLELRRYFGVTELLNEGSARSIYDRCGEMLRDPAYSVRNLLRKMKVRVICTTDDPTDSLAHHRAIQESGFEIRVYPTFRPDKSMAVDNPDTFNAWVEKLEEVTGSEVGDFTAYLQALARRHGYFHDLGGRLSDHGVETIYADSYTPKAAQTLYLKIRSGQRLTQLEIVKFRSAMLSELAVMNHGQGWAQQYHIGPIRNNNTRMMAAIGADGGFDSIGDGLIARPLSAFLDRLDRSDQLARTILYNINPRDNEVLASMVGNFQDGSAPGKMQFGAAWWFLDQKDGMERQLTALANIGLLSRFVGMLTDSRSFLSYPRHEYFRRILCNMLGNQVELGELPGDMALLGGMVRDICYNNAAAYFAMEAPPEPVA